MLLGLGLGMAGFFENKSKRDEAWAILKNKYKQIFKTNTL
jgi:hypothetical protein